jgi:2-phosphosulfolactate phosphatase
MKSIEVCLSPHLAKLFSFEGKIAVIVDILRATSCFVTGLAYGISSIRTVSKIDECRKWQNKGYIGAAERKGQKVDGFQIGNSPFEYMDDSFVGKRIVATTTNGTMAIKKSELADNILLASFLNISAVTEILKSLNENVIIMCAGWEDQVNLEDTVFAGALINMLSSTHQPSNDASRVSLNLYYSLKDNLNKHLLSGDHAQRLLNMGLRKDIEYCLQWDFYSVVPKLKKEEFTSG